MNAEATRKEYVPVSEAAVLCNRHERTIQRWIKKKLVRIIRDEFGAIRIDLDDIKRIQASKPDTVHPIRNMIGFLKRTVEALKQRLDSLEQEQGSLNQEVKDLKLQVSQLLEQSANGESNLVLFPKATRAKPVEQDAAEKRGLPPGTLRLASYADQHKVIVSQIKSLFYEQKIDLTRYEREGEIKRNRLEWWITPEQQVRLVCYWEEHHIPYIPCHQCQGCKEQKTEVG